MANNNNEYVAMDVHTGEMLQVQSRPRWQKAAACALTICGIASFVAVGVTLSGGTEKAAAAVGVTLSGGPDVTQPEESGMKIVGGEDAEVLEFPFMAKLWMEFKDSSTGETGTYGCGGSLIEDDYNNKMWILTAAHCLHAEDGQWLSKIWVRLGEHDLESWTETDEETFVATDHVIHPNYDSVSTLHHDIALVGIEKSTSTNPAWTTISITQDFWESGEITAAGWGNTEEDGDSATVLQTVTLDLISNSECNSQWGNIQDTQICTFTPEKDTCQGDSGGPIFRETSAGHFEQAGVVSYGYGCARDTAGVYTRVREEMDFVCTYVASLC